MSVKRFSWVLNPNVAKLVTTRTIIPDFQVETTINNQEAISPRLHSRFFRTYTLNCTLILIYQLTSR